MLALNISFFKISTCKCPVDVESSISWRDDEGRHAFRKTNHPVCTALEGPGLRSRRYRQFKLEEGTKVLADWSNGCQEIVESASGRIIIGMLQTSYQENLGQTFSVFIPNCIAYFGKRKRSIS